MTKQEIKEKMLGIFDEIGEGAYNKTLWSKFRKTISSALDTAFEEGKRQGYREEAIGCSFHCELARKEGYEAGRKQERERIEKKLRELTYGFTLEGAITEVFKS